MYIIGEYIYIYIGNSFTWQVKIGIARQFMHLVVDCIHIYIYRKFSHIAGEYLYI